MSSTSIRIGVAGATGYAGQELVRLVVRHPGARLTVAMASTASERVNSLSAPSHLWNGSISALSIERLTTEADAVFLALPDDTAAEVAPQLIRNGVRVFDLSGAFRLRNVEQRNLWYPKTPDTATESVAYGLAEHNSEAIRGAQLIACAGCYPTAALLALQPLVKADLLNGDIIIDAKSGISGAGKTPSERTNFSEWYGNVAAYAIFAHRHAAEIEQELSHPVTFVPHLVPLHRGILETIYAHLKRGVSEQDIAREFQRTYTSKPFVRLMGNMLPEIKHVAYTNFCEIGWKVDKASERLVLVACLDNLVKGAAGQAIQNFNVALGFDEREGLT